MQDRPDKIQWHPGFYGAAELELRENTSELKFQTEVELSKKPLRVDLLIIKMPNGTEIKNEIGKIFKGNNIIEYKSPEDGMSIDDFFKTIGYACLYKGLGSRVNQYPDDDITVSMFRDTYPEELFAILKESGRTIEEKFPGIYYIKGNLLFDIQIVVTSELDELNHSAFRILSKNATEADIRRFLKEVNRLQEPSDKNNADAVLQVSISANRDLYDELKRSDFVMCKALEDLMQDVIEERERQAAEKAAQKAANEARIEQAKQAAVVMYENNTAIDLIAKAFKVSVETVEQWLGLVKA